MLISVCKNGVGGPRVLALAPDTPGMPDLEATADGGELAFMREELQGIHIDALIGTVTLTGRGSLADALRDGNYGLLHLITHGDCDFAQLTRMTVSWQDLARLLSQHNVQLVIAMTCNSRQFADGLIAAGTPQVICTTGEIGNDDARQFAREFYGALVRKQPAAEAVTFARSRMTPDGARLVLLLPDEDPAEPENPTLAELLRLRQEMVEWRAEVRAWFAETSTAMGKTASQHDEALRSLTAAVIHLTEVLAR